MAGPSSRAYRPDGISVKLMHRIASNSLKSRFQNWLRWNRYVAAVMHCDASMLHCDALMMHSAASGCRPARASMPDRRRMAFRCNWRWLNILQQKDHARRKDRTKSNHFGHWLRERKIILVRYYFTGTRSNLTDAIVGGLLWISTCQRAPDNAHMSRLHNWVKYMSSR